MKAGITMLLLQLLLTTVVLFTMQILNTEPTVGQNREKIITKAVSTDYINATGMNYCRLEPLRWPLTDASSSDSSSISVSSSVSSSPGSSSSSSSSSDSSLNFFSITFPPALGTLGLYNKDDTYYIHGMLQQRASLELEPQKVLTVIHSEAVM